jgi:5-methylthioadenosine/S-adenosylhomocysteine deaminase
MLEAGLRIGLGTDGCASNNNLDLLQEMDTAAKLAKLVEGDPTCMDAETILAMACSGGASLMGMEHELGTLEPGKRADIVVVDAGKPHLQPCYNPYSNLVYSAGGADVRDVIIDGRVLIRDKRFLYLDPEEIIDEVRRIASRV